MKNVFAGTVLLLLAISLTAFSQEKPEAQLIDEFGRICSEDLMARYDGFLIRLQNDPSAAGYIVLHGENSQEGSNILYADFLTKIYPERRGYASERIVFVRGENLDALKTLFWIVPAGAEPPDVENLFEPKKTVSSERFQKTAAEIFKYDSGEDFINGFYELGCDFAPNFKDFTKKLLENEKLKGYLIIHAKKNKAEKIEKIARKNLTGIYKVPKNRLKIIYGEKLEDPEIELWLVPEGEKPPVTEKLN